MEKINFIKQYNFDNFVVGDSNRFAYSLAVTATKDSSSVGNVFYIYGKNGLGKTHLLHAIGNSILKENSSKKVLYTTSENFTNELKASMGDSNYKYELFIKKYKDIDVLLIDDIHFISGKKIVQEVLSHIFNSLYQNGKLIVLSSDRTPDNIDLIEEKFKSYFDLGILAEIGMPNYELKLSILKEFVKRKRLDIDTNILQRIANFNGLTVRNLEGIINKTYAYCDFNNCLPTIEIVDEILKQK